MLPKFMLGKILAPSEWVMLVSVLKYELQPQPKEVSSHVHYVVSCHTDSIKIIYRAVYIQVQHLAYVKTWYTDSKIPNNPVVYINHSLPTASHAW